MIIPELCSPQHYHTRYLKRNEVTLSYIKRSSVLIAGIALPTMKSVSRIYESSWLTQRNGYIPKHYHAQGDVTIMHRDVILLSGGLQ